MIIETGLKPFVAYEPGTVGYLNNHRLAMVLSESKGESRVLDIKEGVVFTVSDLQNQDLFHPFPTQEGIRFSKTGERYPFAYITIGDYFSKDEKLHLKINKDFAIELTKTFGKFQIFPKDEMVTEVSKHIILH